MKLPKALTYLLCLTLLPYSLFAGSSRKPQTDPVIQLISSYMIAANGNMADGNLIVFDAAYSNAVDGYDALKLTNPGENFGLYRENKALAVEKRQPLQGGDTLVYRMSNFATQTYKLLIIPSGLSDASVVATLFDKFTNTQTSISLTDTSRIPVTFTSNPASKAADRLYILFTPVLRTLPVTISGVGASRNNDNTIEVKWKCENELNIEQYTIESATDGIHFKTVTTTKPLNAFDGRADYTATDLNPSAGINYYRVVARSKSGASQNTAIVKVDNLLITSIQTTVYPNPVINRNIQVRFTNQRGNYNLKLTDMAGKVQYTGQADITSSSTVKTISLNSTVPPGIYQLSVTAKDGRTNTTQVIIQ